MPDRTDTEPLLSDDDLKDGPEREVYQIDPKFMTKATIRYMSSHAVRDFYEAARKEDRDRIAKLEGALRKISHEYQSTGEEMEASAKHTGLDYREYLEMAFDNIQDEARSALTPTK